MAIKIWTALGLGKEATPADLSSQRSSAAHIRRQTRTTGKRDRRLRVRASKERRRGTTDRVSKPKPAPVARRAPRGTDL